MRPINPNPIFDSFAQSASHWIHQNVRCLFIQFVMIPQPMVKKIPLPIDSMISRKKLFPIRDGCLDSGLGGKGCDCVQMIRHQQ